MYTCSYEETNELIFKSDFWPAPIHNKILIYESLNYSIG
jgi:hypothetical protein